jgi:MoxR-like ATPase
MEQLMKKSVMLDRNRLKGVTKPVLTKPNELELLAKVRARLNELVYEREDETDGILLAILSGTSALFFGEPGTAKTYHIDHASKLMGLTNFDILMSETIKPEQIFGPVDIPSLAEGRQLTKYRGYAPDSEVVFFDEIFKANATVLNPLLWLINEKKFRNGDAGVMSCPLLGVFAASNELPTDPLLLALYDRFLLRYEVHYLKSDHLVKKLMNADAVGECEPILDREAVLALRAMAKAVVLPEEVGDLAIKIRRAVEYALKIKISDRRFLKSISICKAMALLNGRTVCEAVDLEVLANVYWDRPGQIRTCQTVVYSLCSTDVAAVSTYLEMAQRLAADLNNSKKNLARTLKTSYREAKRLYYMIRPYKSKYALKALAEVKQIGLTFKRLMKERTSLSVCQTDMAVPPTYKVISVTSMWTNAELRTFGFKHKRKGNYWYYTGPIKVLKANFANTKIELIVSSLK